MFRQPWAFGCRAVLLASLAVCALATARLGVQYPGFFVLAVVAVVCRKRRRLQPSHAHGSARFVRLSELIRRNMLSDTDGIIIGRAGFAERPTRWEALRALLSPRVSSEFACGLFASAFYGSRWLDDRIIRVKDGVHINTVAPSGRGKNASAAGVNLRSYPGSTVVFDPSGELFEGTAAHRAAAFGHRILRIDPDEVCGPGGDKYNVLSPLLCTDKDLLERCNSVGDQAIYRVGTEPDPHWNESACNMVATFSFMICLLEANPKDRNLQTLRDILSSQEKFERAIWVLKQHDHGSLLRRLGDTASWLKDRELASVMSTVQRHTKWMDSPLLAACMGQSTFHPEVLRTQPTTLYIIISHDKLAVWQSYLRLLIGSLLSVLTRHGTKAKRTVLFMLDESAMLGSMRVLEEAVTQYRKYFIKLWFFWQSLDQMKVCFGDRANIILGNMDTQQYFGINDYETAEAISKRIGDTTTVTKSWSRSISRSRPTGQVGPHQQPGSISESATENTSELRRRLRTPEEIMGMEPTQSLVFHMHLPVIPATLIRFFEDKEFTNGRTGRQQGVNLAVAVAMALTCVVAIFLASLVSGLPLPGTPRLSSSPPAFQASPRQTVGQYRHRQPLPSQRPSQRRKARRWPDDYGELIRIK